MKAWKNIAISRYVLNIRVADFETMLKFKISPWCEALGALGGLTVQIGPLESLEM